MDAGGAWIYEMEIGCVGSVTGGTLGRPHPDSKEIRLIAMNEINALRDVT
jgi:hypothetical protein